MNVLGRIEKSIKRKRMHLDRNGMCVTRWAGLSSTVVKGKVCMRA